MIEETLELTVGALKSPVDSGGLDVELGRIVHLIKKLLSFDEPLPIEPSEGVSLAHASLCQEAHAYVKGSLGLWNDGCARPMTDKLVYETEFLSCLRQLSYEKQAIE